MKVIALIVISLLLGVTFRSFGQQASASPANDDAVIEQLRLAGSDLSKPHPIDFYLYAPTQESVERIARVLSNKGFKVKVEQAATGTDWLALATKEVVPTSAALADLRRDLTALALREHGDYDGWEAPVVK
ncbi:ribonuclease E inhibitor RraB [Frateuria sp.]|uniref:ribonuclease E inhibitor RraB n=1 Tax=Frateuria sp. TaxID=2211372 RepID=UPI003F7F9AF8